MRKIFPVFAIFMGLFWVLRSFQYGLWVRRGPGGGFFPLLGGAIAAVFGLLFLIGEIRSPLPVRFDRMFFFPILAILAMLTAAYAVGLLPALALYIFLWLGFYEKYAFRLSALVAACVWAALYVVFVHWLSVPLPKGMLGEMLFG